MGLCINSGPRWEDDTLNDLNIKSIEDNAREMYHKLNIKKHPIYCECMHCRLMAECIGPH
jgi:hypothetical protein